MLVLILRIKLMWSSNVTNVFGGKAMAENYSAVKRPINGQNQSIEA